MDQPTPNTTSEGRLQYLAERVADAIRLQSASGIAKLLKGIVLGSLTPASFPLAAKQVTTELGPLQSAGPLNFPEPNVVLVPLRFAKGDRELRIMVDDDDNIVYLRLLPHLNRDPLPEHNTANLRLPFNGSWLVYWGGDTADLNAHKNVEFQAHAVDFIKVGDDELNHRGAGTHNDDYYCFGQDILAPASGTIADIIQGVRDNRPGCMNPYSALGNYVLILHSAREYSLFAHLQWNSIRVELGQSVVGGQPVGNCGNSGNSSEPHLHFQVQDALLTHDARSIRPVFRNVRFVRKGRKHEDGVYFPLKGDLVESADI